MSELPVLSAGAEESGASKPELKEDDLLEPGQPVPSQMNELQAESPGTEDSVASKPEVKESDVLKPGQPLPEWAVSAKVPLLAKRAIHAKTYFSLAEASGIAGCLPADLLHYAQLGKIGLFVAVPDDIGLRTANTILGGFGTALLAPEMLMLSQADCRKIECNGITQQSNFRRGYIFDAHGNPRTLAPVSGASPAEVAGWVFQTVHEGNPKKIELTPARIFTTHFDLDAFLNGTYKETDASPNEQRKAGEYRSEKLSYLNQAASRFWGNFNPYDHESADYPDTEDIERWFRDHGFGESLAEKAATIIRPSEAKTGRKKEQ